MLGRLFALGLLVFTAACSRQSSVVPPAQEVPAGSDANPATGPATDEAQLAATLQELTQAARRFGMEQQRVPTSVDELVQKGYLTHVPPAPTGKQFAISKNLQVYVSPR